MNTQKETSHTDISLDTSSNNHEELMQDTQKERWLQKYTSRILMAWSHWQTPLGVACAYTHKIKRDLGRFYDDPLKRMFIEATYYQHSDQFSYGWNKPEKANEWRAKLSQIEDFEE